MFCCKRKGRVERGGGGVACHVLLGKKDRVEGGCGGAACHVML